ncbi:MAG: hypothetical protein ABI680_13605, partial [Chthoniobacteraceae bacterium]
MSHSVKRPIGILLMVLVGFGALAAAETKQIEERELDEHSVCVVPVAFSRVTTISFPGPISAIDAALVTTDGKTAGLFQLAYKPGSHFFSVRSLVKGATTNVNVRWNNRTYVLELQDSKAPLMSLSLTVSRAGERAGVVQVDQPKEIATAGTAVAHDQSCFDMGTSVTA